MLLARQDTELITQNHSGWKANEKETKNRNQTRDGTRTGSPPARAGFWKDAIGEERITCGPILFGDGESSRERWGGGGLSSFNTLVE